ncbi:MULTISPECIES: hypothetical protein [Floridanema]|uniref:BAG domain-containing protein n=2 Tax=Floridanema TaxID=3396149 RepID=A0ABV4YJM7_9CYAN
MYEKQIATLRQVVSLLTSLQTEMIQDQEAAILEGEDYSGKKVLKEVDTARIKCCNIVLGLQALTTTDPMK